MPTYLLAWNPARWKWHDIEQAINEVNVQGYCLRRWSCGVCKKIKVGDRLFLIRLGKEPKGIFASGHATSSWFEEPHWDPVKEKSGKATLYIEARLDVLLNPDAEPILPRICLDEMPMGQMHWDTQQSGVSIPEDVADALEEKWWQFLGADVLPEQIIAGSCYPEGAVKAVLINQYERNPQARQKCIEHWGVGCCICGFNFVQRYGEIGEGFVHVHHLKQLSEIGGTYQVDPINDLRPVCPNCHAMLHRRKPAYSIEELKAIMEMMHKAMK